jgi:hypothetical protein
MLLEAETNKYCPGGYDFGAISNLITWVLNFFLSAWPEYPLGAISNLYGNLRICIHYSDVELESFSMFCFV